MPNKRHNCGLGFFYAFYTKHDWNSVAEIVLEQFYSNGGIIQNRLKKTVE